VLQWFLQQLLQSLLLQSLLLQPLLQSVAAAQSTS
jgi:hypothetical protein